MVVNGNLLIGDARVSHQFVEVKYRPIGFDARAAGRPSPQVQRLPLSAGPGRADPSPRHAGRVAHSSLALIAAGWIRAAANAATMALLTAADRLLISGLRIQRLAVRGVRGKLRRLPGCRGWQRAHSGIFMINCSSRAAAARSSRR
jgi:hypothetical protein